MTAFAVFADDYPGDDIGEQINNAIADLPSEGGLVCVDAGSYDYATSVTVSRSRVRLVGADRGATLLHYTGETGSAVVCGRAGPTADIVGPPGGATRANGIVTITTQAAHGLEVGDKVTVNVNNPEQDLDGTFFITSVPSTTTFTYNLPGSDVQAGGGGTATRVPEAYIAISDMTLALKKGQGHTYTSSDPILRVINCVNSTFERLAIGVADKGDRHASQDGIYLTSDNLLGCFANSFKDINVFDNGRHGINITTEDQGPEDRFTNFCSFFNTYLVGHDRSSGARDILISAPNAEAKGHHFYGLRIDKPQASTVGGGLEVDQASSNFFDAVLDGHDDIIYICINNATTIRTETRAVGTGGNTSEAWVGTGRG